MSQRESKFLHQRQFFGTLSQLSFPVLTASCVFVSEGRGEVGQTRCLSVGFLGGINMFMSIPEPLVRPADERSQPRRKEIGNQSRFVEPRSKNSVEQRDFNA